MANIQTLVDELTNDPLARGYKRMTDQQVAADLNTEYRGRNLGSITGDEAFQATDGAEFVALTDVQKQLWMAFCGRETIDPFGPANVAFVQAIFGGGSDTISSLAGLRAEAITRAQELGYGGVVKVGHVEMARAKMA